MYLSFIFLYSAFAARNYMVKIATVYAFVLYRVTVVEEGEAWKKKEPFLLFLLLCISFFLIQWFPQIHDVATTATGGLCYREEKKLRSYCSYPSSCSSCKAHKIYVPLAFYSVEQTLTKESVLGLGSLQDWLHVLFKLLLLNKDSTTRYLYKSASSKFLLTFWKYSEHSYPRQCVRLCRTKHLCTYISNKVTY